MKNVKNNKGFSLVELIIVIAIMAVLIGILAPQYLKFVEKSRLSSDNDYIDSVRKAVESVVADPSYTIPASVTNVTIQFSSSASPTIPSVNMTTSGGGTVALQAAINAIVEVNDGTPSSTVGMLESKTYINATTKPSIVVDFTADPDGDGVSDPTVTVNDVLGN